MTKDEERLTRLEKMISDSRKSMDIEQEIVAYAGRDYAKPRDVVVGSILFEDMPNPDDIDRFIEVLTQFKNDNSGLAFRSVEHDSDYSNLLIGFEAARLETPEEVSARIDRYRKRILQREAERRAEYERMKREFGDA